MAKKHAHSLWSKIKHFSPWYLLGLSLISGFICLTALRQNNLNMVKLRDKVFAADKADGDTETALRNLRSYIYAHMNTNLDSGNGIKPPIQHKYRYERLLAAEKKRVKTSSDQIYTNAQNYCEQFISHKVFGGANISCIKKYVSSHGVSEQAIPDSLYKFDFVSPLWTPDLAGWSLIITIILVLAFVLRIGLEKWVKHDLANS
ncbi:MAG: hypothetical protein ACXWLH_06595 [Candidatus Saccharimonadales bacterium]